MCSNSSWNYVVIQLIIASNSTTSLYTIDYTVNGFYHTLHHKYRVLCSLFVQIFALYDNCDSSHNHDNYMYVWMPHNLIAHP